MPFFVILCQDLLTSERAQDLEALDDRQGSHSFSGSFPAGRPQGAAAPLKGTAGSASAGLPPPASLEAQALASRISGTAGHLIADRCALHIVNTT